MGSTQEMLDEWRPLLCPFDTSMIEASQHFSEFLPTLVPVEVQDSTFKLWLKELTHLWFIPGNHSLLEEVSYRECVCLIILSTCNVGRAWYVCGRGGEGSLRFLVF